MPPTSANPSHGLPYLPIPEAVAGLEGISAGAKLLYGVIARRAGESNFAYPSLASFGAALGGLSLRQVRRLLRELEVEGLVQVRRNLGARTKSGGYTSAYILLDHPRLVVGPAPGAQAAEQGSVRRLEPAASTLAEAVRRHFPTARDGQKWSKVALDSGINSDEIAGWLFQHGREIQAECKTPVMLILKAADAIRAPQPDAAAPAQRPAAASAALDLLRLRQVTSARKAAGSGGRA